MNQEIGKKLLSILKVEQVKKDEPMKIHTTFRVGGPASYFVTPETEEEVAKVIEVCTQENVPYYIVGNGSNLLVSDQGYEGVIIQIYKQMNQVEITENEIHAQAGALLSMIANRAMEAELTGFEFAAGIPGTNFPSSFWMAASLYTPPKEGQSLDVIRLVPTPQESMAAPCIFRS